MLLSRGERGSVLVTPEATELLAASTVPRERTVNTVGAGDALVAGTIVGLRRRWTLSRAVSLGARCSAAMVTTPGTALFDPRSLGDLAGPGELGESSDRGDLVDR